MNRKTVAYRAEVTGTTCMRTVLSIDIVEAEDGSMHIRGLRADHDRSKGTFEQWFGLFGYMLKDRFRDVMVRNGIQVHRLQLWHDSGATCVEEWDLPYKWYNLLENSLQHRNPHRALHINTKVLLTGTHVVLEVDDNGSGISRDRLGQLFQSRICLYVKERIRDEQARGFGFGGHGMFLRSFLHDIARDAGDERRAQRLRIEISTNCQGERSRCILDTDGICIDGEGKQTAGTRVRVLYPGDSFRISPNLTLSDGENNLSAQLISTINDDLCDRIL